ncbi:hypothetical protein KHQ89_05235 [Mycoplasmatota bacterium]|nr:hypothetical protein KHQ89_05235 [Mycoplasmatota bacterium]
MAFRIFGQKRAAGFIVLGVLMGRGLYYLLPYVFYAAPILLILYVFIIEVLPVIAATYTFLYLTRSFSTRRHKVKKRKVEKRYSTIFPKNYLKRLTLYGFIISFGFLVTVLILYIFDIYEFQLLYFIMLVLMFGISSLYMMYWLFQHMFFDKERIIIYIGKDKSVCYAYDVKSMKKPFLIQDVFKNDMYIIDELGLITIYDGFKVVEKNYIYWIATSQIFEINDKGYVKSNNLYKSWIDDIPKYKKIDLKLKYNESHQLKRKK